MRTAHEATFRLDVGSGTERTLTTVDGTASTAAPSDRDPVRFYDRSLTGIPLWARTPSGQRVQLPVRNWQATRLPGDRSLLRRCVSPTLDIGCGPGRLAAALHATGVHALGVDISPQAVAQARSAGASAICRSVFDDLPATGSWQSALLADGNIGIGGDPAALLGRVRGLLTRGGSVFVEVSGPGQPSQHHMLALDNGHGEVSTWFPWALVGVDDIARLAAAVRLHLKGTWSSSGRWFGELSRA